MKERLPSPEQFEEYLELIRATTHAAGKGVRRLRRKRVLANGETSVDVSPKEFYVPGGLRDLSEPDEIGDTHVTRERWISASYLSQTLGGDASKLVVLEMDARRVVSHGGEPMYSTLRNMYRFGWFDMAGEVETVEATVTTLDSLTLARLDGSDIRSDLLTDKLVMDAEEGSGEQSLPTMLTTGSVTDGDFDGLLWRTDEYRQGFASLYDQKRAA